MTFNVAELLDRSAIRYPDQVALIEGRRRYTYRQVQQLVCSQAKTLACYGFLPGDRVLMLVNNSAQFVALTFALFRIGVQPVLIDPGMGLKPLLRCVEQIRPDGLVAVPKGHLLSHLFPTPFKRVTKRAGLGRFPGVASLPLKGQPEDQDFPIHPTERDQTAALLFTSGSTGPAKAVVYRHGVFEAQVSALKELYQFQPGEVDLPGFPLFGLFSIALGMSCVIPPLNPSRLAQVDPAKMVTAIHEHGVTSLQGSPAIWKVVGEYCLKRSIPLPTVRRLLTFGAPISNQLLRTWKEILPDDAVISTPYGATEALPVSSIRAEEALHLAARRRQGEGTCVGRLAPNLDVRIVPIQDEPFERMPEALPDQEIGEVCVRGPVVTWAYQDLPEATRASKIETPEGIWHRMGDLGYLDDEQRLWLVGRKSHRVVCREKLYFPVAAEGMVNEHPEVSRSALVRGPSGPVLVIERRPGSRSAQALLERECRALLGRHPLYQYVEEIRFHPRFPVDPRHNAKIHRPDLSLWVGKS